jgi:hypothetical protein
MAKAPTKVTIDDHIEIDLRDPGWAALLAWLWPGAGHLYQRRYAKGAIFMVGVLSIYVLGLVIGRGHVVYASWTQDDKRWHYLCQLGVGLPALPALIQAHIVIKKGKPAPFGIMAPPKQPVNPEGNDELAQWHAQLGSNFELGTLYTMIAGLLNVLVIYDAFAGPFVTSDEDESEESLGDVPNLS